MLTATFRHLRGIGQKTERELWSAGVLSWEQFEARQRQPRQLSMFSYEEEEVPGSGLSDSWAALRTENAEYFATGLPKHEHYRIALTFPSKTLFLDIETTGLSLYYDTITLVGWSFNDQYGVYLRGGDVAQLKSALSQAKVIVTFNGSLFDLPFLRNQFADLNIPAAHVDLRFLARRVGLVGGQKQVESSIGWHRLGALAELQGEAAPVLWHKYRRGDLDALKLLISYNRADIWGMKKIFDVAVDRVLKLQELPVDITPSHRFSTHSVEMFVRELQHEIEPFIRRWMGASGPSVTLDSLHLPSHNVVGIDLTGSESRPSGWCQLINGRAITRRLGSDNELIKTTLENKPDVVSIDSPLSLPKGRVTIHDSDPGREEFGITRECERILKKRGVNVYPSLIRSMQALTARGIRLAKLFRSCGVPVIESYPGAAQDIMNIPRKRADLTLLRLGLAEFGISGDFEQKAVSHDELDAITSAAVGLFFLSGKYEALGNADEEYLIIPNIVSKQNPWGKRKVVGLSGPISAGKTTVGEFLKSRGFAYGRYSQVLRSMLQQRGIPVARESLQQIGEEVYDGLGQKWLGSELIKTMPQTGDLVIDGLRHPEDHAFLTENFGPDFFHINIDAPEEIRRRRYLDEGSQEDFDKASAHRVESNIPKLAELAHNRVWNADTTEALVNAVAQMINNYFGNEDNSRCQ